MKCPGCQYMCSDLRDLCPKCLLDLRSHKKALGLSLSNPGLTYQELLQKHAQKNTPIKTHGPKGGLSGISQFFRGLWNESEMHIENKVSEARETQATTIPDSDTQATMHQLFENCRQELQSQDSTQQSSIFLEQLLQPQNKEQIELYFALCADALQDPASETRYQEQITTSESRQIKSEALNVQLAKVEKMLSSSVFSLKSSQVKSLGALSKSAAGANLELPTQLLQVAPLALRLRSFLIDAIFVIFFGGLLGLSYFTLREYELFKISDQVELSMLIAPISLALLFSVACSALYPLLSLTFFGTTFGLGVCGLRVLNLHQTSLGRENAWLRSLILPLSMLCFGWLPLLFGKLSLHDRLAKTQVYVEPQDDSA